MYMCTQNHIILYYYVEMLDLAYTSICSKVRGTTSLGAGLHVTMHDASTSTETGRSLDWL